MNILMNMNKKQESLKEVSYLLTFKFLFSDLQSALQAINHNSSKSPIVLDILLKYSDLINHHYDVIFCWIPGHVGIKGNIAADKLARDTSNVITHIILPIRYSDIFPTLRSIIFSQLQAIWDSNPNNKLFFPNSSTSHHYTNRILEKI